MAGFLSYGSSKALSYQHDYGKDMDRLYQREAYKMQVQAEKEKKSAYYAGLMKQHTAAADVNKTRLEDYYMGLTGEVADFAMKHPNWESDVMQTQEMYSLMDKFLNNDIVREDLQVQAEWEKVKQAYSSKDITQAEYDDNASRYEKYKTSGGDPFVFANPKRMEMSKILNDINEQLVGKEYDYTDQKTGKITRVQKTSDENIQLAAMSGLADPEIRRAVESEYGNIPEEERGTFKSVTDYFMQRIKAGEDFKTMNVGYDELYAYHAKKASDQSSYQRQYFTNVYEPLARGESVQPHDALLSFSSWAKEGNTIALGNTNKPFKAYDKNGKLGDLKINGSVKAVGSSGLKLVGGVPYVGTTVQVLIDPSTESPNQTGSTIELTPEEMRMPPRQQRKLREEKEAKAAHDEASKRKMIKDLEDHDFTLSYSYEEGLTSKIEGGTRKSAVYIGTVWEPATFNETARKQYDMTFTGSGTKVAENSELYSEGLNMIEAISTGNFAVANQFLNYQEESDDPENEYAEYKDEYTGKTFYFKRNKETGKTLMNAE